METNCRTRCQRALETTEPDECERLLRANNDITDLKVLTALKNKDPIPLQRIPIIDTESLLSAYVCRARSLQKMSKS